MRRLPILLTAATATLLVTGALPAAAAPTGPAPTLTPLAARAKITLQRLPAATLGVPYTARGTITSPVSGQITVDMAFFAFLRPFVTTPDGNDSYKPPVTKVKITVGGTTRTARCWDKPARDFGTIRVCRAAFTVRAGRTTPVKARVYSASSSPAVRPGRTNQAYVGYTVDSPSLAQAFVSQKQTWYAR